MLMAELNERHSQAHAQVNALRERLRERRAQLIDTDVATYANQKGLRTVHFNSRGFTCCRTLLGHTGKVYSLDWSRNRDRVVSASQDGHFIVWNAITSQKTHAIKLASPWVMTCAFSPGGHMVACGGLDSVCSVYMLNLEQVEDPPTPKKLTGHTGHISCCKYTADNDAQVITGSGDQTCALWDLETGQRIVFGGDTPSGHTSNVTSLSVSAANSRLFVSGSCDRTARLWDTRVASRAVQTYYGHDDDVNAVQFFSDGLRFGTGSDDSTCRIFDVRTGHQLQLYKEPLIYNQKASVTSIAFSHSGRLLFAAYSNDECFVWDTVTAQVVGNLKDQNNSHVGQISCIGLAPDGSALCTGGWDKTLKVWALDAAARST